MLLPTLGLSALLATALVPGSPDTPANVPEPVAVSEPIALWPGMAPGEKGDVGEEKDTSPLDPKVPAEQHVITLGNVSTPTLTVYRPAKGKDTGAAVLVCPGGGYYILAMNLEGTEICHWLNSLGVTAILLKYRVPRREGREKHDAPLQDAQRAMGIVRHRAKEWGLDGKRIGVLGFSAGGHLSAMLSTHNAARTYPPVDEADKESCRPDFAVLIYPAYLTDEKNLNQLAPEITVSKDTPPTFVVQTQDDNIHVENAFTYALALKNAGVETELHVYAKGGHGYGLRPSSNPVSHWPTLAATWLASQGWLKPKP